MKKIASSIHEELPPCTLYWDDVIQIAITLESENNNVDVKLSTHGHDYIFSNTQEIIEFNAEDLEIAHKIEFSSHTDNATISVSLKESSAYILSLEGTTYALGLSEKIKNLLNRKKSFLGKKLRNTTLPVIAFVGSALSFEKIEINLVLIIILFAIWFYGSMKLSMSRYSTIYLKKKKEYPNFFKDKKNDIILATISALIASIITYIFT